MRRWSIFIALGLVLSATPVSPQAQTRIPKYIADAEVLAAQHKEAQALVLLNEGLKRNPDNLVALWWRTRILASLGRAEELLTDCNRLIKADPQAERFRLIYTFRAMSYQKLDETDKAMRDLDTSKRLGQTDAFYHYCRCTCLQTLDRLDEAISELNLLIKDKPSNLDHMLWKRANLLEATNKQAEALADLSKAIELNPKNMRPLEDRARLLERQHRYGEAIEDLGRLLKLDPTEETIYFKRGKLYLATGK